MKSAEFRPCALIPVYNHHHQIHRVVNSLREYDLHCILIDDGSDAETRTVLQNLADHSDDVSLYHLSWNQGKGTAVMDGLMRAFTSGFTHAVQVDADGQHDLNAVTSLLEESARFPESLVSGVPQYDESAPRSRLYGRKITRFWVTVETLSNEIRDAMIGFRVYPLAAVCRLINSIDLTRRMDFDIEVVVRLYWGGIEIRSVPVRIVYPDDGISHFHTVRDNIRISLLHTRLFFGMLPRIPHLVKRRSAKRDDKHWADAKERGTALGIKMLLTAYRCLGHSAFSALLLPVMAYFFATGRKARKASLDYLARLDRHAPGCLPEYSGLKLSFRHFINFGHNLADRFAAWSGDIDLSQLDIKGDQPLQEKLSTGRGAVLLVSHLGNIELCRALADIREDGNPLVVNVLVHTHHAPVFNTIMNEVNPDSCIRLIQVNDIGPETSILLTDMIDRGEMVAIAADRLPTCDPQMALVTDFLGRRAYLPKGPFILASILKCPVFTLFCTRQPGGRYLLDVELFADPLQLPRKNRSQYLTLAAQKYADRLEAVCQKSPLEWFNFFDFWQDAEERSEVKA